MQQSTLDQWTNHPVTKVLIRVLQEAHDARTQHLVNGGLNENRDQLKENYNYIVGSLDILNSILTYDIIRDESIDGEDDHEDQVSAY